MAATEMLGPYRVEHYRCRTRAVATNKAPMAPYRGVARPQMVLAMERLLQKAALPARDRGRRDPPAQPGPRVPARQRRPACRSTRAPTASRSSCARARSTCRPSASASAKPARRAGCSASASPCSPSAPATAPRRSRSARWRSRPATTPRSCAWTRRAPCCCRSAPPATARATRRRSPRSPPTGSGLTPDRVEVRQGDTDATPYGWGTFASRSMVVGGGATRRASDLLAERLKLLAGAHAGGRPRGPRAARRRGRRARRAGQERHVPGDRAARLPRDPQPARGRRARPRVHRELRPARHASPTRATARSSSSTPRRWTCRSSATSSSRTAA